MFFPIAYAMLGCRKDTWYGLGARWGAAMAQQCLVHVHICVHCCSAAVAEVELEMGTKHEHRNLLA